MLTGRTRRRRRKKRTIVRHAWKEIDRKSLDDVVEKTAAEWRQAGVSINSTIPANQVLELSVEYILERLPNQTKL